MTEVKTKIKSKATKRKGKYFIPIFLDNKSRIELKVRAVRLNVPLKALTQQVIDDYITRSRGESFHDKFPSSNTGKQATAS